ncbi:MAG TPA: histidine phosphatase family protein [Stackebrandtia sp.]|jgi:probable phosphoglycerate mutase|uniref:histidine phosphatase family protein n=1 Tax=Stackebrandtia sp. TaxID=2023065 RepID=UPI002D4B2B76|nr:histidine phosphatase family protein [Stackebrandtia sp.]HZE40973.1 histidine phosphatase family protein [Stackebrandtia sp.]
MGEIVLVRHAQTEWSATGRHTSFTDLRLTDTGEAQARQLAPLLVRRGFVAVWCSPARRARHTACLAGLDVTEVVDDLVEWNYGRYEGITTARIHETDPRWNLWTDGCPEGESPQEVSDRVDRVLDKARTLLDEGDVAFVGHGHASRVIGARWIGLPASGGGLLGLDAPSVSVLGHEHGNPVIHAWNHTPVDLLPTGRKESR